MSDNYYDYMQYYVFAHRGTAALALLLFVELIRHPFSIQYSPSAMERISIEPNIIYDDFMLKCCSKC